MVLSCLCGNVRLTVAERPAYINACNCTLCSKTGARWAYAHPDAISVSGPTLSHRREDKADPAAAIHFCGRCGATTHFRLTPSAVARFGDAQAGINMALADPADLVGVELRYPDGRAWAGGPDVRYGRQAEVIGAA